MATLAEFERDLVRERVRSGIAAAKARGQKLGRQLGQRVKADRLGPQVLQMVEQEHSYRQIAAKLKLGFLAQPLEKVYFRSADRLS